MIDTLRIPAMSSSALQTTGESNNHSLKNGEMYADGINWDDLGFGLIPIDYMCTMKWSDGENFSQGHLSPFGKIELCPSTGILNYGQGRVALNLYVEHKIHRATLGGTGGVKFVTNYSPVYQTQQQARAKGFSDVFFLDSAIGMGSVISTPTLKHGTILPGVTHKSIIDIALDFGYQVEERVIPVEDLLAADEAFCTGTAVAVNPIGAVTYQDKRVEYKTGGALCQKLYETLTRIQTGRLEDKKGWTLEVN